MQHFYCKFYMHMSNLLVTWWMPEESQGLETWGRVRQGIGRQGAREAEGGGERDGRNAEPEFGNRKSARPYGKAIPRR